MEKNLKKNRYIHICVCVCIRVCVCVYIYIYIYIYKTEPLCCTPETLLINYTSK